MSVGMVLVVRSYIHHFILYRVNKLTSAHEAIQISPPNLSEGGLLCSLISMYSQQYLALQYEATLKMLTAIN